MRPPSSLGPDAGLDPPTRSGVDGSGTDRTRRKRSFSLRCPGSGWRRARWPSTSAAPPVSACRSGAGRPGSRRGSGSPILMPGPGIRTAAAGAGPWSCRTGAESPRGCGRPEARRLDPRRKTARRAGPAGGDPAPGPVPTWARRPVGRSGTRGPSRDPRSQAGRGRSDEAEQRFPQRDRGLSRSGLGRKIRTARSRKSWTGERTAA
jgi:hypothetical protein